MFGDILDVKEDTAGLLLFMSSPKTASLSCREEGIRRELWNEMEETKFKQWLHLLAV